MDLVPQLAESIDKSQLPNYINDDRWAFSQKIDGERRLAVLREGVITILNRKGEPSGRGTPAEVLDQLPTIRHSVGFVLDGELVGDTYWVFDLPLATDQVSPSDPYEWRREVLDNLAPSLTDTNVKVLPSAQDVEAKLALSKKVILEGGEGIMLNDMRAPYYSGKRHRWLLKSKFVKDVDCFITAFGVGFSSNGSGLPKQNAQLAVYDDQGKQRIVAECIIHPSERSQVDIGSVVTVNYLYATNAEAPRLVQPTKLRPRDDKDASECLLSQIKVTNKTVWETFE